MNKICRERIIKDIELFSCIKREAIQVENQYYLLGLWTLSNFFSRASIKILVEKKVLKRCGLLIKQPKEIQRLLNHRSRFAFHRSRSRATILWEVDYKRLILLIQERENVLLEE